MIKTRISSVFRAAVFVFPVAIVAVGHAQPPGDEPDSSTPRSARSAPANSAEVEAIVARMMAFDKNKDGKLTKDEITDTRLLRLFDRADANHDGVVTREELTALAQKMVAESSSGRGGRGRGGPGGGFDQGPGGGPGRGPRPPQPGQVLSPRMQEQLSLTADQKARIAALQKEVDAKISKILTADQKAQLKEMLSQGGDRPPPPPWGVDGPPDGGNPPQR
jgi:Spy/CpxP family protein refolding chaperone